MTVRIEKPAFNLRSKLNDLDFGVVPLEKMPAGSIIQIQDIPIFGQIRIQIFIHQHDEIPGGGL